MSTRKRIITKDKVVSGPRFAEVLNQLVSGPRVADFLSLDPATIRRYRREGCPAHLIGNLVRYRISEVLAWREKR
jgi:hypothetical protein